MAKSSIDRFNDALRKRGMMPVQAARREDEEKEEQNRENKTGYNNAASSFLNKAAEKRQDAYFRNRDREIADVDSHGGSFYSPEAGFSTQEGFDRWRSTIRDADTVRRDIEALDNEIAALDRDNNSSRALQIARSFGYGEYADVADAIERVTSGISSEDYRKRLDEMKQRRAQLQQELDYSTYFHYEDMRDDADFSKYAAEGAKIGADGVSDEEYAKLLDELYGHDTKPSFSVEDNVFRAANANKAIEELKAQNKNLNDREYLTDDEKEMYNFLLAKEGQESADAYLAYLEDYINQRKGRADADKLKALKGFDRLTATGLYGIASGLEQFATGARQRLTDEAIPISSTQYGSQFVSNELTGLGKLAYDMTTTTANMAPSILLGALTGGAGAVLGTASLSASAAGNAYAQALREGKTKEEAQTYGAIIGASEGVLQYLLGGVSKLGGKLSSKIAKKSIANIDNAAARVAAHLGRSALGEGAEEGLQAILEPVYRNLIFDENNEVKLISEEIAYNALLGALSGGLLEGTSGGVQIALDNRATKKIGADFLDIGDEGVQSLIETGLESDKATDSYKRAVAAQQKIENGQQLTQKEVGSLYRANVEAVNAEEAVAEQEATEAAKAERLDSASALANKAASAKGTNVSNVMSTDAVRGAFRGVESFGYGKHGTDTFTDILSSSDMRAEELQSRFQSAYEAGRQNLPREQAELLTLVQQEAYNAGRMDHISSLNKAVENAKNATIYGADSGLVPSRAARKMNRSTLSMLNTLGKAAGVKITVADQVYGGKANGSYSNGLVTIAADAENPYFVVAKHEVTHHMQKAAPEAYTKYRDYAVQLLSAARGSSSTTLIEAYQANARSAGVNLSVEGAMDEIAADFTESILTDEAKLREFIDEMNKSPESVATARTFLDAIRDFIRKIKSVLTGKSDVDPATAKELGITLEHLENAEKLWKQALKETNARARETARSTTETSATRDSRRGTEAAASVKAQKNAAERDVQLSTKKEVLALENVDWMGNKTSIKEQLAKHAAEINAMSPVAVVEYTSKPIPRLSNFIMDTVAQVGGQNMKNSGVSFVFDDVGAQKIATHARSDELRAAAMAAPYVAKRGKLISGHKNHEGSGNATLTFAAPVIINGEKVNVGVAVMFQANGRPHAVNVGLQNGGVFKIDMTKAPKGLDSRVGRYGQGTALPTMGASANTMPQPSKNVKPSEQMSMKQRDAEYMKAVEAGDMDTAQRMVDEAADRWGAYRNNDEANEVFHQNGRIRTFYHGTNTGDFTVFDSRLLGSSSGDLGWFGKGFYFAFSHDEAATYGGRVIPAYLKMRNPYDYSQLYKFKGSDKGATEYARFAWVYNITKQFPDIAEGQSVWAYPNGAEEGSAVSWKQLTALMDRIQNEKQFFVEEVDLNDGTTAWRLLADPRRESFTNESGETFEWTEYGMEQIFATEQAAKEPINQIGAYLKNVIGVDSIPRRTIEKIDFSGALQRAGYDGILQSVSGDEAVVFSPEQIKISDPVTYDDNGEVIPLSKRFDSSNEDIRYSMKSDGGEIEARDVENRMRWSDEDRRNSMPERFSMKSSSNLLQENAKLKEVNAALREQFQLTKLHRIDKKALRAITKQLLRDYNSGVDVDETQSDLDTLYRYLMNGEDGSAPSWDVAYKMAYETAESILKEATVIEDDVYEQYTALRDYLRSTAISIPKAYDRDIAGYESISEFRKKHLGSIKMRNDGTPVDMVYAELDSKFPGLFDSEKYMTMPDQLLHIAEVINSLSDYEVNPYSYNMRESATWLANDIMERFYDLQPLAQIISEQREKLKAARSKEKAAKWEKVKQVKEQHEKSLRKASERKKQSVYKDKIKRHAAKIDKLLRSPTDTAHVPDGMRKTVAGFLAAIDLMPKTTNKDGSTRRVSLNTLGRMYKLQEEYQRILNEKTDANVEVDPDIIDNISDVIALLGEDGSIPVSSLDSKGLEKLYRVVLAVERSITSANRAFNNKIRQDVSTLGQLVMQENETAQGYVESRLLPVRWAADKLNMDLLNPEDFFMQTGDTMSVLYQQIRDGFNTKIRDVAFAQDYIKRLIGNTDLTSITGDKAKAKTFDLSGGKIELTPAQVMSLYLLHRQQDALDHIYVGGIKAAPTVAIRKVTETVDGKTKTSKKPTIIRSHKVVKVTPDDIGKIIASLTPEQKQIAEGISKFFTDHTAKWGNEVSMLMYGYNKFGVENYFPIVSDRNYLNEVFGETTDMTLKNMGITKSRQKGANNPIIIEDVFDVFTRQADQMSSYHAFVVPLSDIQRVYNYKTIDGSVKESIESKLGVRATSYFKKLMTDINGGAQYRGGDAMMNELISKYKQAKMGLNLRVIMQQPSSFFRAAAVIEPKYLAQAIAHPTKHSMETIFKYAPIAMWKNMGYFSMDTGRQMHDLILDKKTVADYTMWAAGKMDEITWKRLWSAAENEVRDKRKDLQDGSDEFLRAVGERFSHIIDRTQVVDSVLHRSQILRNPDGLVKMSVSFMNEPLKAYNLLRTSLVNAKNDPTKAAKRVALMTATAYLSSLVSNHLMTALIDTLRGDEEDEEWLEKVINSIIGGEDEEKKDEEKKDEEKKDEEKKDEEKKEPKTWLQRYLWAFANNLVNEPLSMLPYVKDVVSIAQGYDVKRMDMQGIGDLVNAAKRASSDSLTIASKVAEISAKIGDMFGIPVSNVKREIETIVGTVMDVADSPWMEYQLLKITNSVSSSKNKSMFIDVLFKAYQQGDADQYNRILSDMIDNGIKASDIRERLRALAKKAGISAANLDDVDFIAGIKPTFPTEKKESNLPIDNLTSSQYREYSNDYAAQVDEIIGEFQRRGFGSLDEKTANELLNAAYKFAEQTALAEASDGEYEIETGWIAKAQEADDELGLSVAEYIMLMQEYSAQSLAADGVYEAYDAGIDVEDYLKFKAATRDLTAEHDRASGKIISGSKKEKVIDYLDTMGLTQDEYDAFLEILGYKDDEKKGSAFGSGSVFGK